MTELCLERVEILKPQSMVHNILQDCACYTFRPLILLSSNLILSLWQNIFLRYNFKAFAIETNIFIICFDENPSNALNGRSHVKLKLTHSEALNN